MSSKKSFYITTPIYYATAKPHLGSLYSTLLADIFARIARLAGKDTFFLTGTDEHGQKIANAAALAGKEPKEFVDSFIPAFKQAWHTYNIAYNRFIRTTDADHGINVQKLIQKLIDQGDIYQGSYAGWYCVPCETFLTEKECIDNQKLDTPPACLSCNRATVWIAESTYFFKLSTYQNRLLDFYKANPCFIMPKERAQEAIKFIEAGLKDLSITRTAVKWGVPFPGNSEHMLYVWIEALCNYITAVGYGQYDKQNHFTQWWPADVQVMAKDIIRFHGVFWPALLMAANLPLPKQLLVHGWIKVNEQKMSKSLGNAVDPMELAQVYDPETIRYFMARYLPVNQDGEFNIQALEQAISADLANDLGNLVNRMILLAEKNNNLNVVSVNQWSSASLALQEALKSVLIEYENYIKEFQLHLAYARVWHFINLVNGYFHTQEPWKVVKTDRTLFNEIISATAHALYGIANICWPVMPKKMEQILASIGHTINLDINTFNALAKDSWDKKFILSNQGTLFIKPIQKEQVQNDTAQRQPLAQTTSAVSSLTEISIDLFKQCEIRTGKVIACQPLQKSEKLLLLTVSFGLHGERQILSGIKKWYSSDDLVGKQFVFLYNLQPRAMMGTYSHGMILCASNEQGKPIPVSPIEDVENGVLLG
ncbi:methionine--tRNA ligase [Candidatus Dependentiae bacterium]|nr:MAG: methionine--tRNA ligase [Candidatus Dependentiae bacterium]